MPIYEYRCCDCAQLFEEWQKDFKEREVPCPVCGGKSERLISNTSFVLKGGGWYVTDYCRGSSSGSSSSSSSSNGNGGSKTNTAKTNATESKPASSSSTGKDQTSSKAS